MPTADPTDIADEISRLEKRKYEAQDLTPEEIENLWQMNAAYEGAVEDKDESQYHNAYNLLPERERKVWDLILQKLQR